MTVPNPYIIHIELYWGNGTRPNQNQVARVNAFESNGTWRGQSGYDPNTGGWQDIVIQNNPPVTTLLDLKFQVVSTSEQQLHMTKVFQDVPGGSTVKIIIGISDEITPPGGGTIQYTAHGNVKDYTGAIVTVGSVQVCDFTNGQTAVLGTSAVDGSGNYSVTFAKTAFENNGGQQHDPPNLVAKYFDAGGNFIVEKYPAGTAGQNTVIDITLPELPSTGDRIVFGGVTNTLHLPVSGIVVQAYHLAWTTSGIQEVFLGHALSDGRGAYEIHYTSPAANPNLSPCASELSSTGVNLFLYARDGTLADPGDELTRTEPYCDAPARLRVNLEVDAVAVTVGSEYTRIHDKIAPCLGSSPEEEKAFLQQLDERSDYLTLVSKSTDLPEELLLAYVRARLIAIEINEAIDWTTYPKFDDFDPEVIYALVRGGKGSTLDQLLSVEPTVFYAVLVDAIDHRIVQVALEARLSADAASPLQEHWAEVLAFFMGSGQGAEDGTLWQTEVMAVVINGPAVNDGSLSDEEAEALALSKRQEVAKRSYDFIGPFDEFVDSLVPDVLDAPMAANLLFVFEVYELVDQYLPIVKTLYSNKPGRGWVTAADLATVPLDGSPGSDWLSYADYQKYNNAGKFPGDVPGKNDAEKAQAYAQKLYKIFGEAEPETRFIGEAEKDANDNADTELAEAVAFVQANEDFDLASTPIDTYIEENELTVAPEVVNRLKQLQRVNRLTPKYAVSTALIAANYDSAVSISLVTEDDFIVEMEPAIGLTDARAVHRKAKHYASEVYSALLRAHQKVVDNATMAVVPASTSLQNLPETAPSSDKFPNWITLFGTLNNCASRHCQTVLSPGAYLTDLLRFIEDGPQNKLLNRRPDLVDIEVTCANTETVLPYIDLVIETLENVLSPRRIPQSSSAAGPFTEQSLENAVGVTDPNNAARRQVMDTMAAAGYVLTERAVVQHSVLHQPPSSLRWVIVDDGWRFRLSKSGGAPDSSIVAWGSEQTSENAKDLEVFPEHENEGAANVLGSAIYPLHLPLELGREEQELLLSQRQSNRSEILFHFREGRDPTIPEPPDSTLFAQDDLAREHLKLTAREANAVLLSGASVANHWGFSGSGTETIPRPESPKILITGAWFELMAEMSIFMNRSQLKYAEVLELLDTEFIHAGSTPRIGINASADDQLNCNYYRFQLTNLTVGGQSTRLGRINHFLRLMRLLQWEMSETDRYLSVIEGGTIPSSLTVVSQFQRLLLSWKLEVREVMCLLADLDRRRTERHPRSQFDEFFKNGATGTAEFAAIENLSQGLLSSVPINGWSSGGLSTTEDGFKNHIRASLNLKAPAMDILWSLIIGSGTTNLNVSLLSAMARVAVFCRAQRITIEEYRALFTTSFGTGLFGISAFQNSPDIQVRISALFDAASEIERMKKSGGSVALFDYTLRHFDLEGQSLAPAEDTEAELHGLLTTAARSIQERYQDQAVPQRSALGKILEEIMPAERVPRILDVLGRDENTAALTEEEVYFRRYLTFALGTQIDAVINDVLASLTFDEEERISSLWRALRPNLVQRARASAAIEVAAGITGVAPDRVDRMLNQMLTSVTGSGQPAIADWIFGLSGWNTGDDVIDRTLVTASTTWESGWLVPGNGHFQPVVALESTNPGLETTVTFTVDGGPALTPAVEVYDGRTFLLYPQLPDTAAATVVRLSLTYGGPHRISMMVKKDNDDPRILGAGELSPFDANAHLKLYKATLLSSGMSLERDELVYLSQNFSVLDQLPLDTSSALSWTTLSPFLDALAVNRSVSLDATTLIRQWLEEPLWPAGQTWTDARAAQLSGWDADELTFLRSVLWTSPPSYSNPWTWGVLRNCMSLLRSVALSASQVLTLIVQGTPTRASAAIMRDALRSSYSDETWSKAFKPLRDKLRQRHRDALVGVLTDGTSRQGLPQFVDDNDMYAYFLFDTQMEPDVQLSRIKLALNVVQLFVQRVFMGLEGETALYELNRKKEQWTWMRNYRVWEANRKVFLWPENWIEPELRDDKTELFKTLEDQLLQDDVTDERARELLVNYAEGLEELAKLLVVGACFEPVFSGGVTKVLHIVARTRSAPYTYYHRTFDGAQFHDGLFTPWKKIPLEIDAESVAPAVVNGALHIAWPLAIEKGKVAKEDDENAVDPLVEIRFIWSKLSPISGKWSKPKSSKEKVIDYEPVNLYHRKAEEDRPITKFYHFRTGAETDGTVNFELVKTNDPTPIFPEFDFEPIRDALRDHLFYHAFKGYIDIWETIAQAQFDASVRARNEQNAYLMPKRLGIFTVSADGSESASVEANNLTLSSDIPRHVTMSNNAAERAGNWEVDGELPQNRYGFRGREILLNRVFKPHRTVSTNLGFFDKTLNEPFFFETSDIGLFGLHRETRRVPGLSGVVKQGVHFQTFSYPVIDEVMAALRAKGPAGIMDRLVQALPTADYRYYYNYSNNYLSTTGGSYVTGYSNKYSYYGSLYLGYRIAGDYMARGVAQREFEVEYRPTSAVQPWYPWPTVSFEYGTSLGIYNWELFFHVPLLIADRLTQQMRFEEAMKWYHFVFDPRQDLNHYEKTKSWAYALPPGARYWNFLPFFANDEVDETLLDVFGVTKGLKQEEREDLRKLIDAWRANPFNPHLIARQRISAYQKATVMKYLDNLIAWADQLFRRDTFESINEATQLYILAAEILGDRPEVIEPVTTEPRYTYRELEAQKITDFSNVLVEVESLLVGNSESVSGTEVDRGGTELEAVQAMSLQSLYFSVPRNTKLEGYWDTVADRLFKIRNSMNIDGVKRTLALFAPPIDPALLVKAAAAGLDLSTVIAQLNRPQPHYRFRVWQQKSVDLINEVKSFGGALLSALEKKDAEELSLLRQGHEIRLLKLTQKVREDQVKEAEENIEALQGTRELAVSRYEEYTGREYKNAKENTSLKLAQTARGLDITAGVMNTIAGTLGAIPQVAAGAFSATAEFGGQHLNSIFTAIASAINTASGAIRADSAQASTLGGYDRRQEDWDFQAAQAALEIEQIDKQIASSEIRAEIARKELLNQEVQIEQSEEVQAFLQDKFSNKDLYQWMAKELTRTYRQAYTLAYDVAKTAERAFRHELGLKESDFIQFGYMDGPQGLLAGEKLGHDLRRMDIAYLEQDKREFELTKQISLASLDPGMLEQLRETGSCEISVPEVLYDLDFPGQYFRRIQAVRLTIPCVTGPYTTVSAKLSLLSSAIRTEATADPDAYSYRGFEDPRFTHSVGGIQSIATSTAQDDSGLFELNFNDERYLPFEGSGAISRWRLELPETTRQFDYHTISDVVLSISYTARDAGGSLKLGAETDLENALNSILRLIVDSSNETGLVRVFSMKREFPDELHRLLSPTQSATVTLRPEHFHYLLRSKGYNLEPLQPEVFWTLISKQTPDPAANITLTFGTNSPSTDQFAPAPGTPGNVHIATVTRDANLPFVENWQPEQWQLSQTTLTPDVVDDLLVTIRYRVPTP